MPRPPFRIIESNQIYRGRTFRLFRDRFILNFDKNKVVTRELVDHPGAVVILPLVGRDHVLLLRQFRYAAKGDLWEIPAGTLEKNENPLACAKREIEEETGFKARRWRLLTRFFPAPGISNELMTLYEAKDLVPGSKNLEHDEWIEHTVVSLKKARRMIRRGAIRDAKTIVGLLWVSFFKKKQTRLS